MTLTQLTKPYSPLHQYTILMRADEMFLAGRYYGGPLTQAQIEILVKGLPPTTGEDNGQV